MKNRITIDVYNIFFTVTIHDQNLKNILKPLLESLTTYKLVFNRVYRRMFKELDKEYFAHYGNHYRFTINNLKTCMRVLGTQGMTRDDLHITQHHTHRSNKLDVLFNPDIIPRKDQLLYIAELVKKDSSPLGLVDLRTGAGKSMISVFSLCKLNKAIGIVIIPKYLEKWKDDIKKYTNATDDDIYVVVGASSLVKLLEGDIYYKFVIFSTRTLMNYISSYIKNADDVYLPPYLIMEKLKLGNILNDETHQDFYTLFMISLFLNADKYVCLSATLQSKNADTERMYKTMFPDNFRISNLVKYEPYLHVYAVKYELYSLRGVHFITPNGYSHTLLEQSIMRNSLLMRSYINMILYYVNEGYILRKKEGQRLLIYAATVKMCTILTNYIQQAYPKLDVRRYVEEDAYSNILEADICVSSYQSAGAAIDIPNLITVIQTVSMKSIQANLQTSGRLREIEGTDVRYYYLYAGNIPKQKDYHFERKVDLAAKTKEWHDLRYNTILKV